MSSEVSKPQFSLCLEASGEMASAAIFRNEQLLSSASHHARHGHAETLIGLAETAFDKAEVTAPEITQIIAGCGPGSFTGLRVCLAAAQGYVLATGAQAVGVNGLAAQACHLHANAAMPPQLIISCADSRAGSLFVQLFDHSVQPCSEILNIPLADVETEMMRLIEGAQDQSVVIGGGAPETLSLNSSLSQKSVWFQLDAELVGRFVTNPRIISPVLPLEPLYIIPPRLGKRSEKR